MFAQVRRRFLPVTGGTRLVQTSFHLTKWWSTVLFTCMSRTAKAILVALETPIIHGYLIAELSLSPRPVL